MRFVKLNMAHYGWNKTALVSTVIRVILTALFLGICAIPYVIVPADVPLSQIP